VVGAQSEPTKFYIRAASVHEGRGLHELFPDSNFAGGQSSIFGNLLRQRMRETVAPEYRINVEELETRINELIDEVENDPFPELR